MKSFVRLGVLLVFIFHASAFTQVSLNPSFPGADEPITITYNASQGTSNLQGVPKVYMHAGVITSGPSGTVWQYVKGNWGVDDGIGQMQAVPGQPNQWRITINPRQYFNVPAGIPIYRIGMVFREGGPCGSAGLAPCKEGKNAQGQDIFVNLSQGFQVSFTQPEASEVLIQTNQNLEIRATSSLSASLQLFQNGVQVSSTSGTQINYNFNASLTGTYQFVVSASANSQISRDTLNVLVAGSLTEPLPVGLRPGINYVSPSEAVLVLEAPKKKFAHLIGDFNDWSLRPQFQMKQTPDQEKFWFRLSNLVPGQEYMFQYVVDGQIRIADPYSEKISREGAFGDAEIIAQNRYPGLKQYPAGKTRFEVSYLQTNQAPYNWQHLQYTKPAAKDLVIYELLVRDFTDARTYSAVRERLDYLKGLGINAIELMPIKEFEGNISWGYNPAFFFAPDKYYGPKNELKRLIDEAHGKGMVVILDMVLNHAFGQNPFVRLYNEGDYGRPTSDNPWLNVEPTHPFNVGYDFNHESPYTQRFVDSVNHYWLKEYKFDGYRFDLSKGFTQKFSGNNVGLWSQYDASRIALLKRMMDQVRKHSPDAYMILEHFADNNEEKELSDYGFLLWGNLNFDARKLARGENADLAWAYHGSRNWSDANLVSYMESHDEERLAWDVLKNGATNTSMNLRLLPNAIDRLQMQAALFFAIPGPKLLWQFGEFGYDEELNNNRLGIKPTRWNYLENEQRQRLYKLYQNMLKVRQNQEVFKNPDETNLNLSGLIKTLNLRKGNQQVFIIANAALTEIDANINFPATGKWFDMLSGAEVEIFQANDRVKLKPNQFHILTKQKIEGVHTGITSHGAFPQLVTSLSDESGEPVFYAFPNPAADILFVQTFSPAVGSVSLRITDMAGRAVALSNSEKSDGHWTFNISALQKGIYILEYRDSLKSYRTKIIKK
jgi:1,4-alpha-glucan branching enzyme